VKTAIVDATPRYVSVHPVMETLLLVTSSCRHASRGGLPGVKRPDGQIIEVGRAISLGPESHLPRVLEGGIVRFKERLVVEELALVYTLHRERDGLPEDV
jgi:hypothetical protein